VQYEMLLVRPDFFQKWLNMLTHDELRIYLVLVRAYYSNESNAQALTRSEILVRACVPTDERAKKAFDSLAHHGLIDLWPNTIEYQYSIKTQPRIG